LVKLASILCAPVLHTSQNQCKFGILPSTLYTSSGILTHCCTKFVKLISSALLRTTGEHTVLPDPQLDFGRVGRWEGGKEGRVC